jgi:hypothetical protein
MRVTVHRVKVTIWHMSDLTTTWSTYAFAPSPATSARLPSGAGKSWSASEPVAIEAPVGSRMNDAGDRLITHFAGYGLDGTSAYTLALHGSRGFKLVTAEIPKLCENRNLSPMQPTATPVPALPERDNTPVPPWEDPPAAKLPESQLVVALSLMGMGLPAPVYEAFLAARLNTPERLMEWLRAGAPPEGRMADWGSGFMDWVVLLVRKSLGLAGPDEHVKPRECAGEAEKQASPASATRWGIAFGSRTYHGRTFLALSAVVGGPIASTKDLSAVASWANPAHADGWLRAAGLDPARPVSPGLDYLYPVVAEIPDELPGHGVEFELARHVPAAVARADVLSPGPVSSPVSEPKGRPCVPAGQAMFAFSEE